MNQNRQPPIRDLAVIGDRRTCAFIDKQGAIVWYCPWRFDQPSLFSYLVDVNGGRWGIEGDNLQYVHRYYEKDSATLITEFQISSGMFTITDCMPVEASFTGVIRLFSPAPASITQKITLTPDYGRARAEGVLAPGNKVLYCSKWEVYLTSSHPMVLNGNTITIQIPAGEHAYTVLLDDKRCLPHMSFNSVVAALDTSKRFWYRIMQQVSYTGLYRNEFYHAYKTLHLMTHASSGGIIAAATTSLPEQLGGSRNYDYRYVWLRDTAMNISALVRAQSKGGEALRFLDFLCTGRNTNKKDLFVPFYDLDAKTAPRETLLPMSGYRGSQPVRVGNGAYEQMQLDAQGNVLLAAKQIYQTTEGKPHWQTIQKTAEYLVNNWHKKDHGIWEESVQQHYTSSKVLAAKSLEFIAAYAENDRQKKRWNEAARAIRNFIDSRCITPDGAYAVYAGSSEVDVTAALYAVWLYDDAGSAVLQRTISRIEADYRQGHLYRRHLVCSNSGKEGVFLAASLWMAQYYVMLGNLPKAKNIIDAVLSFATDLGFLPEEGDVATGELLGNLPQTFVHASLMGVILDYQAALKA